MTERTSKQHDKETDRNANEPKVQDISKLVDQSTITLQDLDQRMQQMRASLSHLIAQANLLQGTGPTSVLPYSQQQANPWMQQQEQNPWGSVETAGMGVGPFGNPFGASPAQLFGPSFGQGHQSFGPFMPPSGGRGISPTGSPTFQSTGFGETRTTRDLKDIPPQTRQPASDVVDDGNNFQIRLEMPGVKKEDMDIMVTDRAVLVTALARLDLEDGVVVVQERGPIVYRRTIQLPGEIKTSECQAKLKDGVLRLSVPKKNPTDSPRHLEIAYG